MFAYQGRKHMWVACDHDCVPPCSHRLSAPLLRKEDGRGTATPMDYDTMATLVKKVLDTLGINVCKVTHCMRVAGAQYLESQG